MRPFSSTLVVSALLATCLALSSAGCATPSDGEGFAIYLTRHNVPPAEMEKLSHVELADEPIISMDDIVSYDASTHDLTLTLEAFDRLAKLQVPTNGRSFVVCVDNGPLYWGAFWTLLSSQSFDGVTIWQPLGASPSTIVQIRLGYPGQLRDGVEDPRNDPAVLEAFRQAGKLIVRPPLRPVDSLPQSFKGYELYSWQEESDWCFTLITGTNRNKTAEEILSPEPLVTADGWVQIQVLGVDELKATLSRVPQGEYVVWFDRFYGEGGEAITLPPQEIVAAVASHAAGRGLDFAVTLH